MNDETSTEGADDTATREETSVPPAVGDRVGPVEIHGISHGGDGVAHDAEGRVLFVPGGLPEERIVARRTEVHERWSRGAMLELPDPPSDARTAAPCPHFGTWPARGLDPEHHCGGCQWQHAVYEAQLEYKRTVMIDALTRLAGIEAPPVDRVVAMADPWHYRNRLRTRVTEAGALALIALDGRTQLPIDSCPITHPRVTELMDRIELDVPPGLVISFRAATSPNASAGERMIRIEDPEGVIDEIDVGLDASVVVDRGDGSRHVASGRPFIVEWLHERPFIIPAGSFFQVNTLMAERLAEVICEEVPEEAQTVVDTYCGVGTWTVALATHGERPRTVWGIDEDPEAISAAVENAEGLDTVTLLEGDATEGLESIGDPIDALVVDPPRTGMSPAFRRLLARKTPRTIVYVSCEPATLARDVGELTEAGYQLRGCRPLDMFPQTRHIESVSTLVRSD